MKTSEKKMILIIILVGLLIIGMIALINKNKNKKRTEETGKTESQVVEQGGIKENTSNKLKEEKEVNGLKVNVISVTEESGVAKIRANITNTTGISQKEFPIKLQLKNDKGEVLQEVGAYVGKTKVDETRQISASVNMQVDEIYDIEFVVE